MQKVFVLSQSKEPLMPTHPAKARKLLDAKRAKLVRLQPFTIQLMFEPITQEIQGVTLGVDTGSKHIGIAAVVNAKVVYAAEAELRQDIPSKMETRASLRRGRRSRLRYRPARWSNRANSKREGRLTPTVISKMEAHKRLISFVATKLLPVSRVVLELASFDTQKMQNPEIDGVEYQRGTLAGYELRHYLYQKWGYKCAYCKAENVPFEIEHIQPVSRGGSSRVSNLAIACHKCNQAKGNKNAIEFGHPEIMSQAKASLKDTAHVSGFRWQLWDWAATKFGRDNVGMTYGFTTKFKRVEVLKWAKSHANDAVAIALEVGEIAKPADQQYNIWLKERARRNLHTSVPTKCHEFTKGQLRAMVLSKNGKADPKLIEKGLAEGWLRTLPSTTPIPTKKEALEFYQCVPGYQIVRYRLQNKANELKFNKAKERVKVDGTCGKMGKWRKGHVINYLGNPSKLGIIKNLDKGGQFRYGFFDGSEIGKKKSIKKAELVMRRTGINHWPLQEGVVTTT